MQLGQRARVALIGTCAVLVALIAIAFAVGGSGSGSNESAGGSNSAAYGRAGGVTIAPGLPPTISHRAAAGTAPALSGEAAVPQAAPSIASREFAADTPVKTVAGGAGVSSATSSGSSTGTGSVSDASSVDATRIVKTGDLTVRVAKSQVQTVTQSLTTLASAQGGYVSSSNTNLGAGEPSGEVVLRIPVAHFADAIAAAEKLGHVLSLTTSADDVTGKYVDLGAREHALEASRSTYLTILSRARTIGATLSVQDRIDSIQQQIDQLHGQLKLLGNQSSYSTLTVDVVPVGTAATVVHHHSRHGLGKAWHTSWSRFDRGVDAMVSAIGPILFAVILLAVVGLLGALGYRGARRVTG
jgi:Domain of unknown function (DUF4349)